MALSVVRTGLAAFGVLLLGMGSAAAQNPNMNSTNGTSSSSNGYSDIWADKTTVEAKYAEAAGEPCTGGTGVRVCPVLKSVGDPKTIAGVLSSVKGKELKLSFCVSMQGVPEDPQIIQSSGKERTDREMIKFIKTYRYTPGTVDGAPSRLCGVQAAFKF